MGFSVIAKPRWLPPAPAATAAATGCGTAAVATDDGADGAADADADAADTHLARSSKLPGTLRILT